jgi:Zn-dependent protease with chaperone function
MQESLMSTPLVSPTPTLHTAGSPVEPWPSELPLFYTALVLSLLLWAGIIATIVGMVYAAVIALVLVASHAMLVYHVRANGVRVGLNQLPELYSRVREISQRIGLEDVPDAYVVQAGGVLNAFATKFIGKRMVVLNSELLEACGENGAARDMIVGHELGHIRAGHLDWRWLIAPGLALPFLGGALSRAREYTCDRYGRVAAAERDGAELGLLILAAGGRLARQVNRSAFIEQRAEISGFWMSFAQVYATHPPLTKRLAEIADFRA